MTRILPSGKNISRGWGAGLGMGKNISERSSSPCQGLAARRHVACSRMFSIHACSSGFTKSPSGRFGKRRKWMMP